MRQLLIEALFGMTAVMVISSLILDLPPYLCKKFKEAWAVRKAAAVTESNPAIQPQPVTIPVNS
ncbi:hypothetical protein HGA34_00505 [Candidatus Falkowbacteria bacterium]|nr:hypothetical protein [Candidatus Falkowbacteria bacterium]